jgi:hypothetical protein
MTSIADGTHAEAVSRAMRELADRIEREARDDGELDPIEQSIPSSVDGGEMFLEFGSLRPPDPRRYLEVRLEVPGHATRSEDIRGSNDKIVALLRAPHAVDRILAVIQRLLVPPDDQIPQTSNTRQLVIAPVARSFADEVERAPQHGPFEHVVRSIGQVEPAGELAFRFAPNPLEPDRRFLELRVSSKSGKTTSGRWIKQGTNREIAEYLRDAQTPDQVVAACDALLAQQRQDGYG